MHRLLVLGLLPLLFGQPVPAPAAWSVALDPPAAHAVGVHWTISLSASYCGGYAIDDGVFIELEDPLALPDSVPSDGVLFAGEAADVSLQDGVLRVVPSALLQRSMLCMQGDRPFTVELLPSLGMSNPDGGTYTVSVRLGSTGASVRLPITISDSGESSGGR